MSNLPPQSFWDTNQSFLIISPQAMWNNICDDVRQRMQVSKFDYHEIGGDVQATVEEARTLRSVALRGPTQGAITLCRINFADNLLAPAANTLLKILEEVPRSVRFLLFAETNNALPTIQSRCSIWHAVNEAKTDEILLPLASGEDFGTVSMKIAKLCDSGQALDVIDGWTALALQSPEMSRRCLRWLIEIRYVIASSNANASLLLEATYAHLISGQTVPSFEALAERKNLWAYLRS